MERIKSFELHSLKYILEIKIVITSYYESNTFIIVCIFKSFKSFPFKTLQLSIIFKRKNINILVQNSMILVLKQASLLRILSQVCAKIGIFCDKYKKHT